MVNSENGVVYGATYVDVNAKKDAFLVLSVLGILASVGVVVASYIERTRIAIGIVGLWVILIVALGTGWPSLLQTFSVDPNEFAKENDLDGESSEVGVFDQVKILFDYIS